jgi:hypothetical protein
MLSTDLQNLQIAQVLPAQSKLLINQYAQVNKTVANSTSMLYSNMK